MWQCSYCPFTSSRKWNTQVHEKRKHQVQLSTSNDNVQRKTNEHPPAQLGQTLMSDHNYVQGQQAMVQQQGGRVQVLHQQHDRKHQVHQQPMQSQPTDCDLMEDSIQVFKIYKLLQRMKNK